MYASRYILSVCTVGQDSGSRIVKLSKKLRILITNTGDRGTGSGTVVEGIASALIGEGHDVRVFCPTAPLSTGERSRQYRLSRFYDEWRFPIVRNGVELYTFPLIIPDPHPRNFPKAWTFRDMNHEQLHLYMIEVQREVSLLLKRFRPHVVECQHIWAMDFAMKELGYPYITVAHFSDQMGFDFDTRMRSYAIEAAQGAKYIFAISQMVRQRVIDRYGVEPSKVIEMPNGFDQEVFRPRAVSRSSVLEQYDLRIPEDTPLVTFAGKLSRTKGIDILLKANRLIQKSRPVHFLLFGAGEWESVLPDCEHSYSTANVHVLGHRPPEALARAHNVATCSVLPSRQEGFGLSCLEAMGCGTPVVVTKTGGPDTFAVGKCVERNDPQALADAVIQLLSLGRTEYLGLRDAAARRATEFSWEAAMRARLKYYTELAELTESIRDSPWEVGRP